MFVHCVIKIHIHTGTRYQARQCFSRKFSSDTAIVCQLYDVNLTCLFCTHSQFKWAKQSLKVWSDTWLYNECCHAIHERQSYGTTNNRLRVFIQPGVLPVVMGCPICYCFISFPMGLLHVEVITYQKQLTTVQDNIVNTETVSAQQHIFRKHVWMVSQKMAAKWNYFPVKAKNYKH